VTAHVCAFLRVDEMEDFVDEDTGKLGYTKKQEIFLNGYQNIIVSPHYMRPNYRIVVGLAIYFVFAFIISDMYSAKLLVPHTFSMYLRASCMNSLTSRRRLACRKQYLWRVGTVLLVEGTRYACWLHRSDLGMIRSFISLPFLSSQLASEICVEISLEIVCLL
jgi:hypothetical protein